MARDVSITYLPMRAGNPCVSALTEVYDPRVGYSYYVDTDWLRMTSSGTLQENPYFSPAEKNKEAYLVEFHDGLKKFGHEEN